MSRLGFNALAVLLDWDFSSLLLLECSVCGASSFSSLVILGWMLYLLAISAAMTLSPMFLSASWIAFHDGFLELLIQCWNIAIQHLTLVLCVLLMESKMPLLMLSSRPSRYQFSKSLSSVDSWLRVGVIVPATLGGNNDPVSKTKHYPAVETVLIEHKHANHW